MDLKSKLLWFITPIYMLLILDELLYTEAFMKSVRIDEIPFTLSARMSNKTLQSSLRHVQGESKGIYALNRLDQHKGFLKIFQIPYIICFYAAKGKWPFIPPFMQNQVDAAARTLFSKNDTIIKQFCQKWIQIKECFRPFFSPSTTPANLDVLTVNDRRCKCANLVAATEPPVPVVYFDRDHIGNISVETISNTIEFLQNFLPPKQKKRKNRVRSRVDDMDIE